jgi:Mlc titration factor MtfA (ptsG expression regulator)
MLFAWLKRRRRRKVLAQPFPAAWLHYLETNMVHYGRLDPAEQAKLRDDLRLFIAEKRWEGCGGLVLTDEMKVTIAGQACLLTLNLEPDAYARVTSVLVYPTGFRVPDMPEHGTGIIDEEGEEHLGEAWYRGPVILSWEDVLWEGQHPGEGRNLVYHEFAHQLDMLDGVIDGTPPLRDRQQARRWQQIMTAEYNKLVRRAERGRATLLDHYGATSEGEFFAVATECFFDQPREMKQRHPELYDLLREYYRQDPAERMSDGQGLAT